MEIRLSRYNLPFSEPSSAEVHYLSLDDQFRIRLGLLDAHVELFKSLNVPPLSLSFRKFRAESTLDIFDPLSGVTHTHDLTDTGFFIPAKEVVKTLVDHELLNQLRKRSVAAAIPSLSRCTCGNSRRPWRCVCNK